MRRIVLPILAFAVAALGGCLSSPDYDDTPAEADPRDVDGIRRKSQLDNALSALAEANCDATIGEKLVRVVLYAGPKGLPAAATLQRMSEKIVEITGMAPAQHLIATSKGKILFTNGAPVP